MSNPAQIHISVTGDDPQQVLAALVSIVRGLDDTDRVSSVFVSPDGTEAEANIEPPKKRKRAKPPYKVDDQADDQAPPAEPDTAPPADTDTDTGAMKDLTPTEAREVAIKKLQAYFTGQPNAMKEITKLQTKYGVKAMADVPAAKAHDLLADVLLLVGGSAEAD